MQSKSPPQPLSALSTRVSAHTMPPSSAADAASLLDLDLSRYFLPESLTAAGASGSVPFTLGTEERLWRNQIRASSYLHLFDRFEAMLSSAVRARAHSDPKSRDTLEPLLGFDVFDHHELFHSFEEAFAANFTVEPHHLASFDEFGETLAHSAPLALLVLALHFKLVTQQHYLACVRGDERLESHFVQLLKEHWNVECGASGRSCSSTRAIQQVLAHALPGRVPAALRDYRILIFACDDVLRSQAELDIRTLEARRGEPFDDDERSVLAIGELEAHRKTFLTIGIVNAAFVYAMRSLGPTAPAMLAGVVSALSART